MAIGRTGGDTSDVQWLRTGNNFENVSLLARGKAKLIRLEEMKLAAIDPIVRIDHSIRPVYPDWLDTDYINSPEFLELERSGPSEFDASRLRKWWHPKQRNGVVSGRILHAHLKAKRMLQSCLGLADIVGIQEKGNEFFCQNFRGQAVFGWRSVVPNRDGDLCVPFLVLSGGRVVLDWDWLDVDWDASSPALRFAN
jgi:hypothetical protein